MSSDMDQYRDVFLAEAAEFVQSITNALLVLEKNPADTGQVETLFRAAHSLKGMAGMMNYPRTAEITHTMESLIDQVRKGVQVVDASLVDLMLHATDVLRQLIEQEASGGVAVPSTGVIAALLRRIEQAAGEAGGSREGAGERTETERPAEEEPGAEREQGRLLRAKVTLDAESVLKSVRAYMVVKRLTQIGTIVETVPSLRELEDEQFGDSFEALVRTDRSPEEIVEALLGVSEVASVEVHEAPAAPVAQATERETTVQPHATRPAIPRLSDTQTVRVSIGHLDKLVDLVGELVILRSRLLALARTIDRHELSEAVQDLHQVSAELQHEVMQTRMVPVGNIFNRFPRMVRDLAKDLGKDIAFELDGLDIELDRSVLDEIGDPLLHLLRNSIDHGIEPTAERIAAGKPGRGTITLQASREPDFVRIVVTDDGRGIDIERVWAKACKLGLVEPNSRESLSEREILAFTCVPGFTTAEHATKISGRGVGMDVVKGRIEQLGGTLSIASEFGKGTQFVLTLPLTLAIIQALMLGSGDEVYALPLSAVHEVLAPDELLLKTVDNKPVAVLRDDTVVPLVSLEVALTGDGDAHRLPDRGHIVLLEVGDEMHALAVPHILGRQEVVIKPLSKMFRHLRGLSGATVLGDGRVALILDPRTLLSAEAVEDRDK